MSYPINIGFSWSPRFKERMAEGFERLQKEADGEIIRLVTPYVPLRTGALANSAKISTVLGSGLIRHTTPYAAKQYYRCPAGKGVRADGRGPHWGERCVADHKADFAAFVQIRANEVLK